MKARVRLMCHVGQINPVPRAYGLDFLSFDLPVRQAHGPEALEGEALDRWYGAKTHAL
jgi:hypothetical protein